MSLYLDTQAAIQSVLISLKFFSKQKSSSTPGITLDIVVLIERGRCFL